jgi:hypothetical protein
MSPVIDEESYVPLSITSFMQDSTSLVLSSLLLKSNQYNDFPFYHVKTKIDYDHADEMRYRIRVNIESQVFINDKIFDNLD